MRSTKPPFAHTASEALIENDREERQLALEYLVEAWNAAEEDGVEPNALAHASLFAAITTFVHAFGDDAAADLIGGLTDRIRSGEYNLTRSLQ